MLYKYVNGELKGVRKVVGGLYFNFMTGAIWLFWNGFMMPVMGIQDWLDHKELCMDFVSYSEAKENVKEALELSEIICKNLES